MTIEFDKAENGGLKLTSSGFSVTRSGVISGVAGEGTDAYLVNAYNDAQMPAYGSAHPTIAGIILLDISIEPMPCNKARVVLSYRVPDPIEQPVDETGTGQGLIEISARSVQIQTEKDRDENQISVAHDFSATEEPDREIERQGGVVSSMAAQTVLRQTRTESAHSLSISLTHINTINELEAWGFPAETLLCTKVASTSNDGGLTYSVSYEFQHDPNKWTATAVFIDPRTGRPPDALATTGANAGIKEVDLYHVSDFNFLNLSF